jgi:hypothetical protein
MDDDKKISDKDSELGDDEELDEEAILGEVEVSDIEELDGAEDEFGKPLDALDDDDEESDRMWGMV